MPEKTAAEKAEEALAKQAEADQKAAEKEQKAAERDKEVDASAASTAGTDYGDSAPASKEQYVGVDPMYQNHANDTEAALPAGEGVEKVLEEAAVAHEEELAAASEEAGAVTGHRRTVQGSADK